MKSAPEIAGENIKEHTLASLEINRAGSGKTGQDGSKKLKLHGVVRDGSL